jgi:hypothetical protein
MRAHTGKLVLLIALLGLWAALFALRQSPSPPARTAPPRSTAGAPGGGLPRLKTELFRLPPPVYTRETQNIFGEPPPPSGPSQAAAAAAVAAAPAAAAAAAGAPPPDPFLEGAKGLRYVGYLQRGSAMTAFIVQGQHVYTLAVNGTIEGRYQVRAIAKDSVILSSVGGDKQVRLALTQGGTPPPRR